MGTMLEYIDWRGDIRFSELGICEVDNLIFSQLCYVDFKGIVPTSPKAHPVSFLSAAKRYMSAHKEKRDNSELGMILPPEIITLMTRAARSVRFGSTHLAGYVNRISDSEQKQFSAITFLIGDDDCFIAIRGTDDTIVGWKESFNLSFMSPIPAQLDAVKYVESVADAFPHRRIYVGGHSKGGNLAVWGAVKCRPDVNARIERVFNNDGPGFDADFIGSEEYSLTRDRIRTLVPQSSIVGMLLEHEESYEVIKSTNTGLLQHNAFSWDIKGGRFIHTDSVTEQSKKIDTTLKAWLDEMDAERRKQILDSLYDILASNNVKTLTELNSDKLTLIKAWNSLDPEARRFIRRCITLIVRNIKK